MHKTRWVLLAILAIFALVPVLAATKDSVTPHESPITFGLFPRRANTQQFKMFSPMAAYLSKAIRREVKLITPRTFDSFWSEVELQRFDLVHFNQYHYIRSHKEVGYQVILKIEELGGSRIAGALIVRKDSGIDTIQDLRGKKIAFGGGLKAMQSHIVPRYMLIQAGLKKGDYLEEYVKNPPVAVMSTYYKSTDASGAGDTLMFLDVVKNKIDINEMKFLARSEPMPQMPFAVKAGMQPNLKAQIQAALVDLKNSPQGRDILKQATLTGLVPATDDEYDLHRKITAEVLHENY